MSASDRLSGALARSALARSALSCAALARSALSCAALALACAAAGCAPAAPPPERDCTFTAWAKSTGAPPRFTASFLGWPDPGLPMTAYGRDDWYYFTTPLPPGEHGYLVEDAKGLHPDRYNPQRTYRGDAEVSLARGQDCGSPAFTVESVEATDEGEITLTGTFLAAPRGDDPGRLLGSVRATDAAGRALEPESADPQTGRFVLRGAGFSRGKYTFRIEARDASGAEAVGPSAVAWIQPVAKRWEDGLLYQVVVDRFRGDGGAALAPPGTPGLRAGGTLDGVRAAIEEGYFDALGVSALWLSPVYENPAGLLEGRDGQMYEAFHGYWVLRSRGVEPRIGGEAALRAVIEAAHARGMRVLFDFVPNHLHEDNERYVEHAGDGWFNNGPDACVCGAPGCGWGERLQDCWFAPYLPDVRWQAEGSMRETLGDLRSWMREFDADGVRIDATPMMPRLASRRMAAVLREDFAPERALFSIGEVFTGPGSGGTDSIKYFLGPDGLDGAFDFPLTWALRGAIADGTGGFQDVEASLEYTEEALRGSGSLLGLMVDNHDMPRFLTVANGEGGADAWSQPATVPADARPYEKLTAALALVMTLPGLPVLYYGTEVGLEGGSDPDNRRVLPAEGNLSTNQKKVLETARRLGQLRRCSSALRAGDRKAFLVTERTYGYARRAPEEAALIMISTEAQITQILPPLAAVPAGIYADALTGEAFDIGGGQAVPVEPYAFRILLPGSSKCLSTSKPLP